MASILDDLGITNVTKAINGLDALESFKEALLGGAAYSLVFLDIIMPGMDGQEALKRMRTVEKEAGVGENGKTTIIMTTSLSSPADMITAIIEGDCTDYVVKPVSEGILRAMLTRYGLIE
jgi:two-component system chemotaxis response regulator CheY